MFLKKNEFLISFIWGFILAVWSLFSSFFFYYKLNISIGRNQKDIENDYLAIIFIAPFLETILFNSFVYYILIKLKIVKKWQIIVTSTLLFSVSHFQNLYLIFVTIPVGLLFSTRYYNLSMKYNEFFSTANIIFSHMVMNISILLFKIYFITHFQ